MRIRSGFAAVQFILLLSAIWLSVTSPSIALASDFEHFHPSASDDDYVWANTANAMNSLAIYSSLTTYYANDQLVGTFPLQNRTQVFTRPIEHRIATEALLSIGLIGRLDLSASLPVYLKQISDNYPIANPPAPEISATGIGDIRLRGKFAFFKSVGRKNPCLSNRFNMALAADLYLQTGDANKLMGNGGIELTPWFLLSYCRPNTQTHSGWGATLNVGYRFKRSSVLEDINIDDEIQFRGGISRNLIHTERYTFAASIEAGLALGLGKISNFTPAKVQHRPAEALFSIRGTHRSGIGFFLGGGLGVLDGYGSPDIRGIAGIDYRSRPFGFRKKTKLVATQPGRIETMTFDTTLNISKILSADPDPDGDNIASTKDQCPMEAEDIDKFEDEDGCPEPDNDYDTISDKDDKCPLEAETRNGFQDNDGCPDVSPQITTTSGQSKPNKSRVSLEKDRIVIDGTVFFKSGSDQILAKSFDLLDEVAAVLRTHLEIHLVLIEGHTDDRGIPDKNVDLSERRAASVAAFLEQAGVAGHRFLTKGFGATTPIASNQTKSGRAKNRRVVFKILNVEPQAPKTN